jgi:probable H4MPT-linked C1 transfer pathway protein
MIKETYNSLPDIYVLGLDIGGANTKAALIQFRKEDITKTISYIEYFPFWEKNVIDIPHMFKRIEQELLIKNNSTIEIIDKISVTITAELSDAFPTKREGIITILNALEQVFNKDKLVFISNDGTFLKFSEVLHDPHSIAAANWVSTALFLGKHVSKTILIDAGSTTIDIIPILNSKPVARGKSDVERMINHELIYTGGLRATIPSITHFVPYKGKLIRISFEKFALVSDVHLILHNISEKEYINDTADNRSKSLDDCYARLSRIICMDLESISKEELTVIANYIYEKQLEIIKSETKMFIKSLFKRLPEFKNSPQFVITGLSADFLIKRALEQLGYTNIKYYENITNIPEKISSSAFAVAGAYYFQSLKN